MKNIFEANVAQEVIDRINNLTADTQPQWGKMTVGQMLAHLCVPYDFVYTDKYPRPGAIKRFLLKTFVKKAVVGPKPYPKNNPTAPEFKITDERDFETERDRLIANIKKTQELGEAHFDGKDYPNFGNLTKEEWNALFYKHIDHHMTQFGV